MAFLGRRRRVGDDERRLVLVVGIGRSGTSAFTSALGELGYAVPQPEVTADPTNPRGFGEPQWVVDFQQEQLTRLRISNFDGRTSAWDLTAELADDPALVDRLRGWLGEQFAAAPRVVVKDPRTAWLLPVWERACDVPIHYVTLLRHPAEVVSSARRWYGEGRHESSRVAGWVNVMLHTELVTRDEPRAFVRYDALLADWRAQLTRVDAEADLGLAVTDDATQRVDAFIDPSLRRERVGWDDVEVPAYLVDVAERAWTALSALADGPAARPGDALAELDAVRDDYAALYRDAERIAMWSIAAARSPKKKRKPAEDAH